jgi:hypothetical protein
MKTAITPDILGSQMVLELPDRELLRSRSLITVNTGEISVLENFLNHNWITLNIENVSILSNNDVDVTVKDLVSAQNLCAQVIALFSAQCEASLV